MTLGELINLTRLRLDDIEEPYLWSDEFLTDSLNQAESEAAERSYLLRDRSSDLTSIPYVAGQSEILLDSRILYVEQVQVAGRSRQVPATSANELDRLSSNWRARQAAYPACYLREDKRIVLTPTPTLDGVLHLVVVRTPLKPMESEDDSPELEPVYHEALIDFAMHKAYTNNDADGEDYPRANEYLEKFTAIFRRRRTARFSRMQQDHVKNSTAYMRRFN